MSASPRPLSASLDTIDGTSNANPEPASPTSTTQLAGTDREADPVLRPGRRVEDGVGAGFTQCELDVVSRPGRDVQAVERVTDQPPHDRDRPRMPRQSQGQLDPHAGRISWPPGCRSDLR